MSVRTVRPLDRGVKTFTEEGTFIEDVEGALAERAEQLCADRVTAAIAQNPNGSFTGKPSEIEAASRAAADYRIERQARRCRTAQTQLVTRCTQPESPTVSADEPKRGS